MPYPDRLLAQDEEVVHRLHPHWKMLVLPVLGFVVVAGVASFAAALTEEPVVRYVIIGIGLLIMLTFTIVPVLRWRTTHFVITSHRVLVRRGILSRSGRDVPLSRINDVSFEHSFFERLLGCGTLVIESAGARGQVSLEDVPRVERVQGELYQLIENDAERRED